MSALGAGVLVGTAVWLVLDRGGRPAQDCVPVLPGAPGRGESAAADGPRAAGPRQGPRVPWRRKEEDRRLVLVVIAQVSASLRTGSSPGQAWEQVAGVPSDAAGIPTVPALAPAVGGTAAAHAVVAACRLAAEVGAPLAEVLEQVGRSVVDEAEARADRDAALRGPQATARVLGWLPVAGVALGAMLGANPVDSALDGGIGTLGLLLGVLFQAAGRWWTRRLLDRARVEGEVR